jgi:hypothetical protein
LRYFISLQMLPQALYALTHGGAAVEGRARIVDAAGVRPGAAAFDAGVAVLVAAGLEHRRRRLTSQDATGAGASVARRKMSLSIRRWTSGCSAVRRHDAGASSRTRRAGQLGRRPEKVAQVSPRFNAIHLAAAKERCERGVDLAGIVEAQHWLDAAIRRAFPKSAYAARP